jgi:hypothetical protein
VSGRVVVFGGYGTFGARVCRELSAAGVAVDVAGRDEARAQAFAASLGPGASGLAADVRTPAAVRAALVGRAVAVCCAGPFATLGPSLLEACLDAGCHSVDIADDRAYAADVRRRDAAFAARGLTAAYGCSSLPTLSIVLAQLSARRRAEAPAHVRITLFIGNDNVKGSAAVAAAVGSAGRPVAAPQGTLRGFGNPETVELPAPFGPRRVYTFESPDYDLLPAIVGTRSVAVKVGFESRLATAGFALLARVGARWGDRTARLLSAVGALWRGGSSGGTVMAELDWADGSRVRAAFHAVADGQRLAALPCAWAAQALVEQPELRRGAMTGAELLGPDAVAARVTAAGFALHLE